MFLSPHAELKTRQVHAGGAGQGAFVQSVGTHDTQDLLIASGSRYELNGGKLSIEPQGSFISRGHLSLAGGTLNYDPTNLRNLVIEGTVDFGTTPKALEFSGIQLLDNVEFLNVANGTLSMSDPEGVLLISPAVAASGVIRQTAGMPAHVIGSGPLDVSNHTLDVRSDANSISDTIQLSDAGVLRSAQLNTPFHWLDGGSLGVGSTILVVQQGRSEGTATRLLSDQLMSFGTIIVAAEGRLEAEGSVSASVFTQDGALQIGSGVSLLDVQGALITTNPLTAQLIIDVAANGSDLLTATSAVIGGELRLVVPAEAADGNGTLDITIGQTFDVVTATSGLTGEYNSVTAALAGAPLDNLEGGVISIDDVHDKDGTDFSLVAIYDLAVGTVTLRASLPGDFNFDNAVDVLDLDILGAGSVPRDGGWSDGDANQDGRVDLLDLDILSNYFFATSSGVGGSSVPEPNAVMLTSICLAALLGLRSRVGVGASTSSTVCG